MWLNTECAEYPKIQTVFKRDGRGAIIEGEFSIPAFEYLRRNAWVWTEKVDGTNIRVHWDGTSVWFGGKTDNAQLPVPLVHRLNDLFTSPCQVDLFASKFARTDDSTPRVTFYGEGYGAKIQKNGSLYRPGGVDFVLFDVLIDGWWLHRRDVEDIAKTFGIECVPVLGTGDLVSMIKHVRTGFTSRWGDFPAEGIVARPIVELQTRRGDRIITKLKTRDFGGW